MAALLPTHAYQPGKQCPPHLSPFTDGAEGYVPAERLRSAMSGEADEEGSEGGEENDDEDGEEGEDQDDDDDEEEEEEEDDDDDEEEEEDDDDEEDEDDETAQYKREMAAEAAGVPVARAKGKKRGALSSEARAAAEEKELAKGMMSRKKQRLYERMQYGIKKKAAAADVLKQKRAAIEAADGKQRKKGKKS